MEAQLQVVTPTDTTAADEQIQQSRAAIEALMPDTPERELMFKWTLPDGRSIEKVYTQAALGMFPIQEFTTRMTEVINSFIQGEMGMKLGDLFAGRVDMPTDLSPTVVNKVVEENLELIKAFIQLVQIAPDLQLDIMCLSMGVPRKERGWAKEQLQEPPHRGGPTVEEGFDILIHFIRQNAPLLREVLVGKARELVAEFRIHVLQEDPEEGEKETRSETEAISSPTETGMSAGQSTSHGGTPSSTSSSGTLESI